MSKEFKFGKRYDPWILVNMDFASLYLNTVNPCAELGLSMSPREYGRNRERDIILLTRRDMSRGRGDKPKVLIDWYDFSEQSVSRQEFMRASIVLFMDDDGTTKTLKNRYGPTN